MFQKSDLRDAQQRVIAQLYEHDEVQAVMPMGGGKTASALTAIAELIDDGHIRCALIMAPKRVVNLVWSGEHRLWAHLKHLKVSVAAGTPKQRLTALFAENADIYVVGIDNTQWLVEQLKKLPTDHRLFDLLCIDELSRFKGPRGKRGKALLSIADRFSTKWGLTGTPRPNGFEDQWMPLTLLTSGQLWGRKFDPWRETRFMALDYHGYNWSIRPEWRTRTIKDINTVTFATPDEDMPDVPDLIPVFHWLDLPADVVPVYKEMEREYVALITGADDDEVVAANAAVASGKLCQITQGFIYETPVGEEDPQRETHWLHSVKIDHAKELVESLDGDNALIAYEFQEDIDRLLATFPGLPYFGRDSSDADDTKTEADWNAGKLPLVGAHAASAGHGLNLQRGGNQFIIYGLSWSAELHDQLLKRIHRPGQTKTCYAHYILLRDTIDEVKYNRVIGKMTEQDAFRAYLKKV